jgi:hypothetical protein
MQARWRALTEGDRPTLSPALGAVHHTFLDPAFPTLAVPPVMLLELFETRALYLPRLDWLGLVALAVLSPGPLSHPHEHVLRVIRRLSRFLGETAFAAGGEQHVVPSVHYRPGFLKLHRPGTLSEDEVEQLELAYISGLKAIERWLAQTTQPESVLAHRLPVLATPLEMFARNLPTELTPLIDRLRLRTPKDAPHHALALTLLCDEALTLGAPWTVPLLTWMADLTPQRIHNLTWWKRLKAVHTELLARWRLAGRPPTLAELHPLTPEDEQRPAVKAYLKISRELWTMADAHPEEHWRRLAELTDRDSVRGWELLEDRVEPRLLQLCQKVIPRSTLEMKVPAKIVRMLARQPHTLNLLTRLTLMAVSLMAEKSVEPPTQLVYLYAVNQFFRMLFAHGETTPELFDPDRDLLAFLESAGASVDSKLVHTRSLMKLDVSYAACTRAVAAFIDAHPADADWLSTYHSGPVLDEQIRKLRNTWHKETGKVDVLSADHSAVVDQVNQLMILAESRYVLVRELMLLVREVQYDSRQAGKPYPWAVDFHVPETEIIWHFQLWRPSEFAELHVPADRNMSVPVDGKMFLEYLGTESRGPTVPFDPWFLEYLQMRVRPRKQRAAHLAENFDTENSFKQKASFLNTPHRPHHLHRFINKVVRLAPDSPCDARCYVDPDDLYMEVLTAICWLRFARTTGVRLHEFLQLRLDRMIQISAQASTNEEMSDPYVRDQKGNKRHIVGQISPKGGKQQTAAEDKTVKMLLAPAVQRIIGAIVKLRTDLEGKVATAAPENMAVLHHDNAPYVIQDGKRVLGQGEVIRRVRFLLLGWQGYTGSSSDARVKSHAFRYGFSHGMIASGFNFTELQEMLHHATEAMSARYLTPTQSQVSASKGSLLMPLSQQNQQPVGVRRPTPKQDSRVSDQVNEPGTLQQLYDREAELTQLERALEQRL